jgi:DNA-binding response OmpR family regulator
MKRQVVVVEDNPAIRELIEYILEAREIAVISFDTAGNFRDSMAHIAPDLYLLDIMLPDGNGIDLCNELRAAQASRQTPIIMMSAHSDRLPADCNAEDFIAKPFDIDNFVSRIEQQIA